MSKVDLKSKEWCELVFEGRNKEYGAYDMRAKSGRRYLYSMIDIIIGIAVLAVLIVAGMKAKEIYDESALKDDSSTALAELEAEVEEEVNEEEIVYDEPEAVQQEVVEAVNTIEFVVPDIVEHADAEHEVTTQKEATDATSQIGAITFDEGTDNRKAAQVTELKANQTAGKTTTAPAEESPTVYTVVEQEPQFPGGQEALLKYVATHIKYPAIAQEQDIQGQVVLKFVVKEDGSVDDVKVIKGLSKECDIEAVRVVKSLPRFIPGKQQGKAVRVYYTLPIRFQLQ